MYPAYSGLHAVLLVLQFQSHIVTKQNAAIVWYSTFIQTDFFLIHVYLFTTFYLCLFFKTITTDL